MRHNVAVICFAFAFVLVCPVRGWNLKERLAINARKLTTAPLPFSDSIRNSHFRESFSDVHGPRRELKGSVSSCDWDVNYNSCEISLGAAIAMLDNANNPVATYFGQSLTCALHDIGDCEKEGCVWYEGKCETSVKMWDALTSTPCIKKVRYLIERKEWSLECNDIEEKDKCNAHQHCLWDDHLDCVFDRWAYYYSIEAVEGVPVDFNEVFESRLNQIANYFNETYDPNNPDETLSKFMNAPLPSFECPENHEQIVCDYVEAVSIIDQTMFYCEGKYLTESSCNSDTLCTYTIDSEGNEICFPSTLQFRRAVVKGEEVFTARIQDPDARIFEKKNLHCIMQENEYSCTDECRWLAFQQECVLDAQWVTQQIHELIGDSDDPVCRYFDIDSYSGCASLTKEVECTVDEHCNWEASGDYCGTSAEYLLEFAMEISGQGNDFKSTVNSCKAADTRTHCNEVPDYETSESTKDDSTSDSKTVKQEEFSTEDTSSQKIVVQSDGTENDVQKTKSSSKGNLWWLLLIPATIIVGAGVYIWRKRDVLFDERSAMRAGYASFDMPTL